MNLLFTSDRDEPKDVLRVMRMSRRLSQLDLSSIVGYHYPSNTVGSWEKNGLLNALYDLAEALGYDVQIQLIDKR